MSKVVNIHLDDYDVYIGRNGKGMSSVFGNPFVIGEHGDRLTVVDKYQKWFLKKIKTDSYFCKAVEDLRGKTLGCFCAPKGGLTTDNKFICHGLVILAYLAGDLC